MSASILTTLKKLDTMSNVNKALAEEYYEFSRSKDHKSDYNIINQLNLLKSLDKFYDGLPFTSINNKDQILKFLNYRYVAKDKKWVEREHDNEGRWISSLRLNLTLIKTFFRWLNNKDIPYDEWQTPSFVKIKPKKPLRDSPYGVNDIWDQDEVLTIASYEPELRNQVIITLLWDLDARNHEITALRMKDIILREQYGEGIIPDNTKTGGGPILLTSSFTYVRDWINRHPFKNESNARLICNLVNGKAITSKAIWYVMRQLQLRIKRLVESGSIIDEQQKQKLEYLLKTKKWNPYCFRHSAITNDSDHLPDYALKKKVRWSMNSQQGKRYIKNRMGDELKNKILEHSGINLTTSRAISVQRTCGKCNYINKLESKFCEKVGCGYPLTQEALDEIKAAEQAKMQELISNEMQVKNQEILDMKEQMNKMQKDLQDIKEFELQRLKDPSYIQKKQRQEVEEEMKRTGKNLITVLCEKMSIEAVTSPKMMESIKKLPLTTREEIVQELITLAKRDQGYEETHPEIKKIKGLLHVDSEVDTYDVITEEDLRCYRTLRSRFDLETEGRSVYHLL